MKIIGKWPELNEFLYLTDHRHFMLRSNALTHYKLCEAYVEICRLVLKTTTPVEYWLTLLVLLLIIIDDTSNGIVRPLPYIVLRVRAYVYVRVRAYVPYTNKLPG